MKRYIKPADFCYLRSSCERALESAFIVTWFKYLKTNPWCWDSWNKIHITPRYASIRTKIGLDYHLTYIYMPKCIIVSPTRVEITTNIILL